MANTKKHKKTKVSRVPENIKKDREFKLYVLWKSLPPLLRVELDKRPDMWKNTGFGDNPVIHDLLKMNTQGDFARAFDVDQQTLSQWNKVIEQRDLLGDYRKWAKHLTHNLLMAMYNKGIKYGDPYRVELWLKAVHGWKETATLELEAGQTLADIMKMSLKAKRNANQIPQEQA